MIEIKKVIVYEKKTGKVTSSGTSCSPVLLITDTLDILIDQECHVENDYILNGKVFSKPEKPSKYHIFNYANKQWEDPRTLADFKDQQWEAIKNKRTKVEYSGFSWDNSVFDSDAVSQSRIQGAVQLASMSADFSIAWTLQNNTTRLLSAGDMQSVGLALGMHVSYQFQKAQALRNLIDTATTKDVILLINWDMPI